MCWRSGEFVGSIVDAVRASGFSVTTDRLRVRIELSDALRDRHVDLHPVFDDAEGGWWQRGLDDGRYLYPAEALTTGRVGNKPVRCLTVAKQQSLHTGYPARGPDLSDLRLLDPTK